eukprot:SM000096S24857  [mRNA]  locus=s96:133968:135239:+ [translate_table: standard]
MRAWRLASSLALGALVVLLASSPVAPGHGLSWCVVGVDGIKECLETLQHLKGTAAGATWSCTTKATFGDCEVALKNGDAHLAMLEGRTTSGSSLERDPLMGWLLDGVVHARPISDTGLVRGLFLDFLRSSASSTSHGVLHKEEQQLVMGVVVPNCEFLQQVRREDLVGLRLHECAQLQCLESDVINVTAIRLTRASLQEAVGQHSLTRLPAHFRHILSPSCLGSVRHLCTRCLAGVLCDEV